MVTGHQNQNQNWSPPNTYAAKHFVSSKKNFINQDNSLTSLNHSQLPTYFEKATQTDSYLSSLPYRVTENSKKFMQQTLVIELKQFSFYQIKCYFAFRRRTEEACKNRYYLLPQFGLLNFEDNHIEVFDSLQSIHYDKKKWLQFCKYITVAAFQRCAETGSD